MLPNRNLRIVVLTVALGIHVASPAPGTALPAEHAAPLLGASVLVFLSQRRGAAEEDHRDEEATHGGPRETVGLDAEPGILAVGAEGIAALDGPCTVR